MLKYCEAVLHNKDGGHMDLLWHVELEQNKSTFLQLFGSSLYWLEIVRNVSFHTQLKDRARSLERYTSWGSVIWSLFIQTLCFK